MSVRYVGLAVAMWAVTYPSWAIPLLASGVDRLPPWLTAYLRLVGPAVLAALAATGALVVTSGGQHRLEVDVTVVAVALCAVVVARRRNLLAGLAVAVAVAAAAHHLGWS